MTAMAQAGAALGCKVSDDIAPFQPNRKPGKVERKRVAEQLRSATKRKQAFYARARLLTNEDLLTFAAMRETEANPRGA